MDQGPDDVQQPDLIGRRRALRVAMVAAGVAVTGGAVLEASPAAAANGDALLIGNTAQSGIGATTLTVTGTTAAHGLAINVDAANGPGLIVNTTGTDKPGIHGTSINGVGVLGEGLNIGVTGSSTTGIGVAGSSDSGPGVTASTSSGSAALQATALATGTGIQVQVQDGTGVNVVSVHGGGAVFTADAFAVRLTPNSRATPLTDTKDHVPGDLVMGKDGDLWLCTVAGTIISGVEWVKLGGLNTAGAFHVLPAPARIYDSRVGSQPPQGPKTKLTGVPRVLDCKVNASGVPAGASAVALTVLLVNAANGSGNMTVWANGIPRPAANTMVWGAGAGRWTSSTISALDAAAKIQVAASASTDLVLDVVGYYR